MASMDWLEKMLCPLQRRCSRFASRFQFRQPGVLILNQEVEACEYQDVQIMWEMLKKSHTELARCPSRRKNGPLWNIFRWTRIAPCLGTPFTNTRIARCAPHLKSKCEEPGLLCLIFPAIRKNKGE